MLDEVLLFLVPYRNQIFYAFYVFLAFAILPYSYAIPIDFYAVKYLIYIYFV